MPGEEEEEELQLSLPNLNDAAKGKTDTILMTHGKQGGRKVKPGDLPGALQQAGVKKDWKGTLMIAFPDVCKTPAAPGPVPIPYPNIGMALQKDKIPKEKKVKAALDAAGYKNVEVKSVGDEPGTFKSLVSAKAFAGNPFTIFSFDVKMEGKNTSRLMGHEMTHAVQQSHAPHVVKSQTKPIK